MTYNTTYTHFGIFQNQYYQYIYKNGRAFSHFIEPWLAINYNRYPLGNKKTAFS